MEKGDVCVCGRRIVRKPSQRSVWRPLGVGFFLAMSLLLTVQIYMEAVTNLSRKGKLFSQVDPSSKPQFGSPSEPQGSPRSELRSLGQSRGLAAEDVAVKGGERNLTDGRGEEETFILNWTFWEQMMRSRLMFAKFRWTIMQADPNRIVLEHAFSSSTHLEAMTENHTIPLGSLINMTTLNQYGPVMPFDTWKAKTGGQIDAIFLLSYAKPSFPYHEYHDRVMRRGGKVRLLNTSLVNEILMSFPGTSAEKVNVYMVDANIFHLDHRDWRRKLKRIFAGHRTVLLDSFTGQIQDAYGFPVHQDRMAFRQVLPYWQLRDDVKETVAHNIEEKFDGEYIAFNFRLYKFDNRRASVKQGMECFKILLNKTKEISEETGIRKIYFSTDFFQYERPRVDEQTLVREAMTMFPTAVISGEWTEESSVLNSRAGRAVMDLEYMRRANVYIGSGILSTYSEYSIKLRREEGKEDSTYELYCHCEGATEASSDRTCADSKFRYIV